MATPAGSTDIATPSHPAPCTSVAHHQGNPFSHLPVSLATHRVPSRAAAVAASRAHLLAFPLREQRDELTRRDPVCSGAPAACHAHVPPSPPTLPRPADHTARRHPVGSGVRDAFAPGGHCPAVPLPAPMFAPGADPARSLRSLHCVFRVRPLRRGSAPSSTTGPLPGPRKESHMQPDHISQAIVEALRIIEIAPFVVAALLALYLLVARAR